MNPMSSVPSTARPDSAGRPQVLTAPASLPRDVDTRRVLRNTYALLSMTLLFSASIAAASATLQLPAPSLLLTLGGYFGLLFAVYKFKNSGLALPAVFALTGFMGYTLGPILSFYVKALPNGHTIVATAFGITALAFTGLSAYAIRSGRRFSFMGGFLMVGILTAFALGIVAIVFSLPALALAVSGVFVLLMAGLILYQTGEILHGGETNYIHATVTLYVSIYNMFTSLLHLLGVAADD